MCKFFRAILIVALFFILGSSIYAQKIVINPNCQVIVYYFHHTLRCPTCQDLEQYSKETIETNFKNELSSGRLLFKIINIDEKTNEHFVNDYQLYRQSLILSLLKDGKEIKFQNLSRIWEYITDKQVFSYYVQDEMDAFLK